MWYVLCLLKQASFFKNKEFPKEFGGELLKNKRKGKRPLATNRAIHNVLRADLRAPLSFLKKRNQIGSIIENFAKRFNIRIYRQGLARDHVHFIIKVNRREDYANFVRAVSGVLAKLFNFKWLYRPFSRVMEWGRDFKKACAYVLQNEFEGLGIIPHQPRRRNQKRKAPIGLSFVVSQWYKVYVF